MVNTTTTMSGKNQLRSYIATCLAELSEEEKVKESQTVCQELLKYIPTPSVVFGYYPKSDEVDSRPLLEELLKRGSQLFLPCVEGDSLIFRKVTDLNHLCEGKLGNQEPLPTAPSSEKEKPDIILVPGRAFDQEGYRLGRGGGMYDRWLKGHREEHPDTLTLGLAFNCQVVEKITVELHDERVDAVVTAHLLERRRLPLRREPHRR